MAGIVVEQGTPGHFECNGRDIKRRFAQYDIRIIGKYLSGFAGQCCNQALAFGNLQGGMIMTGENPDIALFAQFGELGVDPRRAI